MALRSAEEYKAGLRDGRTVYFRGQQVADVTTHPEIGIGVEHVALDFRLAEDPEHAELFTYQTDDGKQVSRYFKIPTNSQDLLNRRTMIERSTELGGGVVLLIKEIGSDGLFALTLISRALDQARGTNYSQRVEAYLERCRQEDLTLAVAQTDVKGDRSLSPSAQTHPDYYVRIVEESEEGILVKGAKAHTTCAPYVDEIIVIPTRALGEQDRAYAVAFAVPANAKGVKMIASPFGSPPANPFHHPVASAHRMIESLTIFDHVFIPKERIFLKGEWDFAGPLAITFVRFHRFTAISYKPPLCDLLVGASALMADYNGISRASHVREKIASLIAYTETVRALSKAAAIDHETANGGIAVPNPVLTNIAKMYFASGYHQTVREVQDIAGGLVVTGPSEEDWLNPETRGDIEHYLGGKAGVSTEDRLRLFNLVRDLTASDFGGYHELLAIHAEGSLQTQKITIGREYDLQRCVALAKRAAGIR